MKHLIIFLSFVFLTIDVFSQNLIFDKYKFDTSYQIIGLCPFYDDEKEHKDLTFLIDDTSLLNKARSTVTFGKIISQPTVEDNSLEIYVVKNKQIIEYYSASPNYNNVNFYLNDTTPGTFEFDIEQLLKFADIRPLNYTAKDIKFKSRSEFDNYVEASKMNKKFLCYDDITEEHDGKFTVVIHDSNVKKASAGWEIIKSELKRISPNEKDYLIGYTPNLNDLSILTYNVNTSKEIYDKFNLAKYPKGKWQPNELEILAYWKK